MGNRSSPFTQSTAASLVANGNSAFQQAPLLTEGAAARRLGVSPQYLVKWRFLGKPVVPFIRMGSRMIRYRPTDLEAFIQSRLSVSGAPQPRYDGPKRPT